VTRANPKNKSATCGGFLAAEELFTKNRENAHSNHAMSTKDHLKILLKTQTATKNARKT
jgi:hypothetical protein